jgi:pimeloyl-ACP methyl ester carboxylesterase
MPPLRTEITFAKLETIAVPALLLPGDNDLTTPPWVMRRQAAHLPGAEFTIIPEAGHSVNWEQPDAFNRAVLDFIGKR